MGGEGGSWTIHIVQSMITKPPAIGARQDPVTGCVLLCASKVQVTVGGGRWGGKGVLVSYISVTAGNAYAIIDEPPAIGARQDPVTGV